MGLKEDRLMSLDLFRGLTMFLLTAEGVELYRALIHTTDDGTFFNSVMLQFHHHPWNGLRFWDLIQPYFMFIVGVAMPFSMAKRSRDGATDSQNRNHILKRALTLLLLGTGLHCVYNHKMVWELWNVLTQLSVTIPIAYFLMKRSAREQIIASVVLLVITGLAYRFFPVEGYNQPFTKDVNFGSWMDMLLMGKLSGGGWIAVNFIPTAAHTIWGVVAGQLLMNKSLEMKQKLKFLLIAGSIGLIIGYGMDWTGFEPIIKRISTPAFVIASGGWALLTLALFYWVVDIKGFKGNWVTFFAIVGMNPIFIYLFSNTVGAQWFNGFVGIFTGDISGWVGIGEHGAEVITAIVALGLEWGLCYWLYRRKVFFRI
ncbi:MAG: DUF5009 domain-containing protein [Cyclobacteriaceae bacterium]|nr:DUF5009 domain-containing protein [Cyclobacteriaceae bacterium]